MQSQFGNVDITVKAVICNFFADVSCKYTYENESSDLLESSFVFPIEYGATVYKFEVEVGDEKFIGSCRERLEALCIYEETMESNRHAFILLEDEEMLDTFSMKIGNIPPNERVFVTISYFQKLNSVCSHIEPHGHNEIVAIFSMPFLLNSRYVPKNYGRNRQFGKPFHPKWSSLIPYSFHFSVNLSSSSIIKSIASPNNQISVEYLDDQHRSAKAVLFSHFDFTEDFILNISYENVENFLAVESSSSENGLFSSDCVLINFLPRLPCLPQSNVEIIFVIDRSGSMDGDPIRQASLSLLILLKSLPMGCRFQIVGFGSNYSLLFPEPQDNTEKNINKGLEYQRNLEADMGGTEVLPVLKAIYSSSLVGSADNWRREIIFLTDGDVANHSEIITLISENSKCTRLSAIGFGQGASTALVSGAARAGNGRALFVRDGGNLREAVLDVLNCCLQPWLTDVTVDWCLKRDSKPVTSILQVPSGVPPVFSNTFTTFAAFVPPGKGPLKGEVTLSFKLRDKPMSIKAQITQSVVTPSSRLLHRYTAGLQLLELIDQYYASGSDEDRALIVNLSIEASVISPFTAFVGLRPKDLGNLERVSVKIPLGIKKHVSVDYLDGVPLRNPCVIDRSLSLRPEVDTVFEETQEIDAIVTIAEVQLFSGAWTWTQKLAKVLSLPTSKKDVLRKQFPDLHDDHWTTALVLAFLRLKEIKRQTEWHLMAKKAYDWLVSVLEEKRADEIISAACRAISKSI
ncbi:unnamed protein product [Hymenolepis diminuta]|uniref:VWFA domain-containing protein n=1 Tax=Hymenolepis diminuta TaxID=6216 RepID=A0A158QEC2_HYMDI|nr:unnamed protein product [Hymenolepis diminuta]